MSDTIVGVRTDCGDGLMKSSMSTVLGGEFASVMKQLGFRRTGEVYRLGAPGEEQVLFDVQRGRPPATNTFFVNVGIYPQRWLDFRAWDMGVDSVGDQPIGGSILHNRLRAPVDVASRWEDVNRVRHASSDRWIFNTPDEAAQCSRRLAMLASQVVPQLRELLDPDRLLEFTARPWQERGQLSVDGVIRPVLHAVFTADEHPLPAGVAEALETVREPVRQRVRDWIQYRQSLSNRVGE